MPRATSASGRRNADEGAGARLRQRALWLRAQRSARGTIVTPIEAVLRRGHPARARRDHRARAASATWRRVVVGLPLSLQGGDTAQTRETRAFCRSGCRCDSVKRCRCEMHDERFTTRDSRAHGGRVDRKRGLARRGAFAGGLVDGPIALAARVKVDTPRGGRTYRRGRERAREERARRRAEQAGRQPDASIPIESWVEAPSASVAEASGDGVVETPPALDPPVTEAGHVEEPFEAPVEPGASVAEPPVAESPDIAEPSVPPQPLDPLIAPSRGDRDIIAPSRGDRDMLLEASPPPAACGPRFRAPGARVRRAPA